MARRKFVYRNIRELTRAYFNGATEGTNSGRSVKIDTVNGYRSICYSYYYASSFIQEIAPKVYAVALLGYHQNFINNMAGEFFHLALQENYGGVEKGRSFYGYHQEGKSGTNFVLTSSLVSFPNSKSNVPYKIINAPGTSPYTNCQPLVDCNAGALSVQYCQKSDFNYRMFEENLYRHANELPNLEQMMYGHQSPSVLKEYSGSKARSTAFNRKNWTYLTVQNAAIPPEYKFVYDRSGYIAVFEQKNNVWEFVDEKTRISVINQVDEQAAIITKLAG